jgi:elongation factor Ts
VVKVAVTVDQIKELRARTGAGVLDCRKALEASNGDMDKAAEWLREKGMAVAAKKAGREAKEGIIGVYVHHDKKTAAMLELNCETDFVARTDEFQTLARELAMHVVAARPVYVSPEEIPAEEVEAVKAKFAEEAREAGKPENVIERIVEGKMAKYYEEVCLLEQPFVRDPEVKIKDLIKENIAKLGENIVIRRFARFELGG